MIYQATHRFLRELAERRLARLEADRNAFSAPLPIAADYLAGALITLLRWWLEQGMPFPPEEMHAIFQRLTTSGFRGSTLAGNSAGEFVAAESGPSRPLPSMRR